MTENISVGDLGFLPGQARQFQLVDVRSRTEYASGHVPGTVNIPLEEVESRLDDLATQGSIVLVCKSGQRASIAACLFSSGARWWYWKAALMPGVLRDCRRSMQPNTCAAANWRLKERGCGCRPTR